MGQFPSSAYTTLTARHHGPKNGVHFTGTDPFETSLEEEARRLQAAWGDPPAVVDAHQSIYRADREDQLSEVTDTVGRVLGRASIPFDRWVEQHVEAFR